MTRGMHAILPVVLILVVCTSAFAATIQSTATQAVQAAATQPAGTQPTGKDLQEALLTNGRQVFALRMNQDWSAAWPMWVWTAGQWEELSPVHRAWFMAMDDVKSVLGGTHLLVTSSRGGVALINKADGSCAFYAESTNAHSAELVRDRWIVVCSSQRGDQLQVFNRFDENRPATLLTAIPLQAAHGAVYDWRTEILWALGENELLKTKIVEGPGDQPVKIEVLQRFPLPAPSGHDLYPYFHYKHSSSRTPDTARGLFVTSGEGVYVFDLAAETFGPFAPLAKESDVKCIGDNLRTGQILYTKADTDTLFTTNIRFLEPSEVRALPGKIGTYKTQIYKARWSQPNPFSYKHDAEQLAR